MAAAINAKRAIAQEQAMRMQSAARAFLRGVEKDMKILKWERGAAPYLWSPVWSFDQTSPVALFGRFACGVDDLRLQVGDVACYEADFIPLPRHRVLGRVDEHGPFTECIDGYRSQRGTRVRVMEDPVRSSIVSVVPSGFLGSSEMPCALWFWIASRRFIG